MRLCMMLLVALTPLIAQHGSSTTVNPYTKPDDAAQGADLFRKQCSGCHGVDGGGAGAGPALNTGRFRHGASDEALFQTIAKGVAGTTMPAFALTGLQTWQLVTHLRNLSVASRGGAKSTGDATAGAALFRANCLGCHRAGSEGGFSGPDLAGIGKLKSLADLRQSIVKPDDAVPAEYWRVRIRTVKGESVSGVRLNEDTHSIQIREPRGRLRSFLRSEIAQSELLRNSPMPAFEAKLSAREIDDVLAYVASLAGGDQ